MEEGGKNATRRREGGREGRETDPEAQLNPDTLTPAEVASMERVRLSRGENKR